MMWQGSGQLGDLAKQAGPDAGGRGVAGQLGVLVCQPTKLSRREDQPTLILHVLTCRTLTAGARADLHRERQNAPAPIRRAEPAQHAAKAGLPNDHHPETRSGGAADLLRSENGCFCWHMRIGPNP